MIQKSRAGERRPLRGVLMAGVLVALAGCSQMNPWSSPTTGTTPAAIQQDPNATLQAGQVVGGATKQMALDTPPVGGFLPRPELLTPGGPGRPDLVYLNPDARLSSYKKVMIDPVTIWAGRIPSSTMFPPISNGPWPI